MGGRILLLDPWYRLARSIPDSGRTPNNLHFSAGVKFKFNSYDLTMLFEAVTYQTKLKLCFVSKDWSYSVASNLVGCHISSSVP
jgi:hypothetical protein